MKSLLTPNIHKCFEIIAITAFCAILTNCASTPQSRIEKNPQIFTKLKPKQQNLVKHGRIDRNMPKTAVFLAMGNPDNKISGNREGTSYERWDYNRLVPVHEMRMSYVPYYGRNGRRYYRPMYYPEVYYIPRRGASVYFKKGVVTGWQNARR